MFEKQRSNKTDQPATYDASTSGAAVEVSHSPARECALIGSSIRIEGNVSGEEDIVIEGQVDGTIEFSGNAVTIGKSGRITADLTAKTIRIDGEVTGDIAGHEKVVISKTGKVHGNIVAPRVTLEDGAKFKGSIDMDPSEGYSASSSPATTRLASTSSTSLGEIAETSSASVSSSP